MVAEKYDEVVFTNPKVDFHQSLLNGNKRPKNKKLPYPLSNEQSVIEHFRTYGDETDVKAMLEAKKFLEGQLKNVKDRLLSVDSELEEVKVALAATKDNVEVGSAAASGAAVGATASTAGIKGGISNTTTGGGTGSGRGRKKKATTESIQPVGKKAKSSGMI